MLFIFLVLSISRMEGQANYTGFIGEFPVELTTNIYSDEDVRAIYCYTSFDEPIVINGSLVNGTLTLKEKNAGGQTTAVLTFENFSPKATELTGTWTDIRTKKALAIHLVKRFEIESGYDEEWSNKEIIQPVSLKDKYFKLVISKSKENFEPRVSGIKIFQKKTDRLLQSIAVDCQLQGLENIETGDYNFDGYKDFSIFEASYAGPNTSSLYFLYDPKKKNFFNSGFKGVSLEFDAKTKRIFERNQCCMGKTVTTALYKVVKNKMVLTEHHCFKWDEKKEELVERKWKDCE
jgi:hypothetical protein